MTCSACLEMNDESQRAYMRCGYLASYPDGARAPLPHAKYLHTDETCCGYTTELPDVADVAMSYAHWDKGQLHLALAGREASQTLATGVIALASAIGSLNAERAKGGTS